MIEKSEKNRDLIKEAKAAGYYLKTKFEEKNVEHKIPGICYRILNGIKTNNKGMVFETIINSYMYTGSSVSDVITYVLRTKENMEDVGYAFVAGLMSEKSETKKDTKGNGGDNNEE